MNIRPLRDQVVIKRMEYQHPTLAVVGITLNKGTITAVGPGRRMRRKVRFLVNPEDRNSGFLHLEDGAETGRIRPMRVKVGQCVEFSPTGATEFEVDGERFLIVREQSIYGIDPTGSASQATLERRVAGYDRSGRYTL